MEVRIATPVLKVMEAPIPVKTREKIKKRTEGATAHKKEERV
jgi:hypothetical protein